MKISIGHQPFLYVRKSQIGILQKVCDAVTLN